MERPPEPLTQREQQRLVEMVECDRPDLLPLARKTAEGRWLADGECRVLSGVVFETFLEHLGPGDQPDRKGKEADELLGRLEMQREGYWREGS